MSTQPDAQAHVETPDLIGARYKLVVSGVIALFLVPNLWAVVAPFEDWPYSNMPMYAHYASAATPRYRFTFLAELGDEGGPATVREVTSYSIGIDYAIMRYFFKYVYGSVEVAPSHFRIYPDDTEQQFTDRLGRFFAVYAREYAAKHPEQHLRTIRLQVGHLRWQDNAVDQIHEVGAYAVAAHRFTHTWKSPP